MAVSKVFEPCLYMMTTFSGQTKGCFSGNFRGSTTNIGSFEPLAGAVNASEIFTRSPPAVVEFIFWEPLAS